VRTYGHSLADVQGKRRAAKRWASHVTAAVEVEPTWRYLLVSETDTAHAEGIEHLSAEHHATIGTAP
jgi:hypothetical protein